MKKSIKAIIAATFTAALLAGCSSNTASTTTAAETTAAETTTAEATTAGSADAADTALGRFHRRSRRERIRGRQKSYRIRRKRTG